MSRVLITGCNGFVAQDIINKLADNYEIYGIGRGEKAIHENVKYIACDISDRELLFAKVLEQVDSVEAVIHVAAYLGNESEEAYRTNCYGTQNVADLSEKLKSRTFVLISGLPIIGNIRKIPIDEQHANYPQSIYHRTKYLSELICQTSLAEKVRCVILRIASPVGTHMPENKVFSTFVKNAAKGIELSIYGTGKRIQNYIDTRDIGNAVELSLEDSKADGLYVLNGNSVSDLELAKRVIAFFNSVSEIHVQNKILDESEQWLISDAKAQKDFGYHKRFSLEDSFAYVAKGVTE